MKNKTIECFGQPSKYSLSNMGSDTPRILNGIVSVKRYRVTVEEIDEPKEVLRERLLELLKKPGHIDNPRAIREEAKRLGIEL